jgi:putative phosphonate metabolism protein
MRSSYHARIVKASTIAQDMRYAIYFAPPDGSDLWRTGCQWLGRDPLHMCSREQPGVPGLGSRTVSALTERPRRYGFHATLKPPFSLIAGETRENLYAALSEFAFKRNAFPLPRLRVGNLGGFVALRISQRSAELDKLAGDCVSIFDRFRQQPTRAELLRRSHGLDARQRVLLGRWGYPFVMDQWRFHMTLTAVVPALHAGAITGFLAEWFEPALHEPLWVNELCVFVEEEAGGEFRLDARFPMAGPA